MLYQGKIAEEERGAGITRTDTGSGACETVYLTYFSILKRAHQFWHYL